MSTVLAAYNAPGDGSRWYIVERAGQVRYFPNDPASDDGDVTTMIDISGRVNTSGEGGLLDIAFHPDYGVSNFEVFFSYTRSNGGLESVISRFRSFDNGVTLDAAMEEIILTIPQDFSNHNGGQIAFGPDGYLYMGWGDGGSGDDPNNRGQDTTNLLGTFTRIDVDGGTPYAIPADNPFVANAVNPCPQGFGGGDCPEIYAWGMRNPWRWSFDTQTGVLWAGDVGQGAWEEVDIIENGNNYGWKIREGAHCRPPTMGCQTAGLTDPITEYGRSVGVSITGGFVYHGATIPALQNQYIYGDFGSGRIFAIPANSPQGTPTVEILASAISIAAFAQDLDGEVYVLSFAGSMHRIVPAP
jgi:glucose/arabinose dehydrogenase